MLRDRFCTLPLIGVTLALLTSVSPAAAIDCKKATSKVEKAICASDVLFQADRRMNEHYKRFKEAMPPDAASTLRQSQRFWLKRRGWCEHTDGPISECILRETVDRTHLLSGEPLSGPGTGSALEPVFLVQQGGAKLYEVDVAVLRFAVPANDGESAFNIAINELLSTAPMGETEEAAGFTRPFAHQLTMAVTFASPKFISAKAFLYQYTGGAHGNTTTRNFNVDLVSGKAARFADLFEPSARAILTQGCFSQIQEAKRARFGEATEGLYGNQERRQIVNDTVGDLVNWSIDQTTATVIFDPYSIGAYAEGSYECNFRMSHLRALMKPDSPLLQP